MDVLINLLFEKDLDTYLEYFNKKKKNYTIFKWSLALLVFFIYALGALFVKKYWLLILAPLFSFIAYRYPYFQMVMQKKRSDLLKSYLFPEFLRYFISLIHSSGNVYLTLKATIPYLKEPLRTEVQKLVKKIEVKNDRKAYMEFADYIGSSEANLIMSMIYEFTEMGIKKETLAELSSYIDKLHENKTNELIDKKVRSMDIYSFPSVLLAAFFILGFAGTILVYYWTGISVNVKQTFH